MPPKPAGTEEVDSFERSYHITFPDEFRRFLLSNVAGSTMLKKCLRHVNPNAGDFVLDQPFPYTRPWEEAMDEECSENVADPEANCHLNGTVFLRSNGCGYYDFLVITGPERGHVWQDGRCSGYGLYPLSRQTNKVSLADWTEERVTFRQWVGFDY